MRAFEDAFNLLCGDKIASGLHRNVFECRLRPELVVKVEHDEEWRYFANVKEMTFWEDNQHFKKAADWLAPCAFLSPDGRVLLQYKCRIATSFDELPPKIPHFLTDRKPQNYGWLPNGQFVCVDYAMTIDNISTKLTLAKWRTGETEFAGIKKTGVDKAYRVS
jgi:hypothetical protein